MRKLFLTWAAAVAAVALVGCKEDNPEPVPAPVITLESESTVSFFVLVVEKLFFPLLRILAATHF